MNKLRIFEFFNREYEGPKGRILFLAVIGTFAFSLVVAVINEAADAASSPGAGADARLFFLYFAICALMLSCRYYTLTQMTLMAEDVVRKVRVRLTDKIRHTELQFLEGTEKGEIYARVAHDTDLISQSATDIMNVFETIFTSLFIYLYVAMISPTGFVFSLLFMLVLAGILFFNYRKIRGDLGITRQKEADFFDALSDTLSGFKEIRINSKKNDALFADIRRLSEDTERLKVNAGMQNNKNIVFAFVFYEGLLGIVVFAVPFFSHAHSEVIAKLVAAMIFVFGMLPTLSRGIPVMVSANVAVEKLDNLEAAIDAFGIHVPAKTDHIPDSFGEIALRSITFHYVSAEGETLFALGPIDLSVRKGEVLFIVGGNGSGKSTLLKLLTGLYYPMAGNGHITLDGRKVEAENYQSYRELFSIIFTDFHLFEKLYGLESIDEQEVRDFLKEMDIHKKTDYMGGRFTNTDLSTGQRKRIAYIAAVLEDKPIYVFDEWAADQDPEFRKYFYEKLLADLRSMGKTVIAVTHDDKYFDKAGRVLKMEEGKMMAMRNA